MGGMARFQKGDRVAPVGWLGFFNGACWYRWGKVTKVGRFSRRGQVRVCYNPQYPCISTEWFYEEDLVPYRDHGPSRIDP